MQTACLGPREGVRHAGRVVGRQFQERDAVPAPEDARGRGARAALRHVDTVRPSHGIHGTPQRGRPRQLAYDAIFLEQGKAEKVAWRWWRARRRAWHGVARRALEFQLGAGLCGA